MKDLENSEFVPTGHFYSSVPSVETRNSFVFPNQNVDALPGLDLNKEEGFSLLKELKKYHDECPFPELKTEGMRYYFQNDFYSYSDGVILHAMLRHFKPKRYLEIGSGYSSAAVLDTLDTFGGDCRCTFVEPYPAILNTLLTEKDKNIRIVESGVQSVDFSLFQELEENDILFIDSTHVSKAGSDVNFLIHEVLPRLNKGVLVHFHDILWPFEYHAGWIREGRAWNESYMLRAFLEFNYAFKITFFCTYLHVHYHEWIKENMPKLLGNQGGNLWLRKIA